MNKPALSLVVETPQGTMLRRIPAPTPLLIEYRRGIEVEEARRRAVARWCLPDFVFSSVQRPSGGGVREIGDGILIVGGRAGVFRSRAEKPPPMTTAAKESWLHRT